MKLAESLKFICCASMLVGCGTRESDIEIVRFSVSAKRISKDSSVTVEAIVSKSKDVHIDETRVNIGEFNTVGALIEQADGRFSAELSWSQIVNRDALWLQTYCVDGIYYTTIGVLVSTNRRPNAQSSDSATDWESISVECP